MDTLRFRRLVPISVLALTMACTPSAPKPGATIITNGNFETGTLSGWSTETKGAGGWFVYQNGDTPPNPAVTDSTVPFHIPNPPEGKYAVVTDMNDRGSRFLYQDLKLDGRYRLRFTVFYENGGGMFVSQNHFDFTAAGANQQFRVDLMTPTAKLDSVADQDMLASIFHTRNGDPLRLAPQTVTFDLSPWAGQAVRLRFAQADTEGPLRVGVDAVALEPVP